MPDAVQHLCGAAAIISGLICAFGIEAPPSAPMTKPAAKAYLGGTMFMIALSIGCMVSGAHMFRLI